MSFALYFCIGSLFFALFMYDVGGSVLEDAYAGDWAGPDYIEGTIRYRYSYLSLAIASFAGLNLLAFAFKYLGLQKQMLFAYGFSFLAACYFVFALSLDPIQAYLIWWSKLPFWSVILLINLITTFGMSLLVMNWAIRRQQKTNF